MTIGIGGAWDVVAWKAPGRSLVHLHLQSSCVSDQLEIVEEDKENLTRIIITFLCTLYIPFTNDISERSVKLKADFATGLTADDDMRTLLLNGVERNRKIFPSFMKSVLNR